MGMFLAVAQSAAGMNKHVERVRAQRELRPAGTAGSAGRRVPGPRAVCRRKFESDGKALSTQRYFLSRLYLKKRLYSP